MVAPAVVTENQWTYERYLRETAEGEYFAIIQGEKVVSPSPTSLHQAILINLSVLFQMWLYKSQIGKIRIAPFDVVFSPTEIVQPDLILALTEHLDRLTEKNFQGAPDLVIEILSPGSRRLDRVKKRALYARYHVPEYWIVSPGEKTVEVLRWQGDQYVEELFEEDDLVQSPLLPGFTCVTKDIFVE